MSYGSFDTYTAMSKLVGLPAAIATELIVRGKIIKNLKILLLLWC